MFNNFSHAELQAYWWVIISLLGALLVFLMFVQGGQTLLKNLTKNDMERSILINSIGRKWDICHHLLLLL